MQLSAVPPGELVQEREQSLPQAEHVGLYNQFTNHTRHSQYTEDTSKISNYSLSHYKTFR